MDDGAQTLLEVGGAWTVPLTRMTCALDAVYEPASDTIRCAGSAVGFAMYGPHLPVGPGLYEVAVDIALTGQKNPVLDLDLWIEGRAPAKRGVVLDRARVVLRGWVNTQTRLEVRAHTASTGFVVHNIRVTRLDPMVSDAGLSADAKQALYRRQLRAAIGFDDETHEEDGTPPVDLLDAILADPGFLLLDDAEVPSHEVALRRSGIDPIAIQLLFARNNTHLVPEATDLHGLMGGHPDVTNAFQLDILRDGALTIPSPFGPGVVTSRASFPVLSPIQGIVNLFYEFAEPRHLIVGANTSWIGALSFIWFVDRDVLVYDKRLHWSVDYEPTLPALRAFVELCGRHCAQARAYRAAEKTVACVSGFISNMGHYIWNEVSGVERVLRAGHRPPFLLADRRWLPLCEVFREDGLMIAAEVRPDRDALFLEALSRNFLLVRPTGNAIDAALAAKVERAARGVLMTRHPERLAAIDALATEAFVLFFNLRAHNKSWIEQIDGAAEVVARLRARFGSREILVFLDGYGDCSETVRAIADRLDLGCLVIDGTDVSFAETLVWAYRCDLFVAVIGSGLVPLTWLAAKPGVCHGDHRHLDQMNFWLRIRPGYDRLSWPLHVETKDIQDTWYSNYSISSTLIADLAMSQLDDDLEAATPPS